MENEVVKPMSISRSEFVQSLTDLINGCKLPLFVIEAVLKDMYNDVHILAQRQLEIDVRNYKNAIDGLENGNKV